jgi:spore maturation protein CgeB
MRILMIGALMGGSNVQGRSLCRSLARIGQDAQWLDFTDMRDRFEAQRDLPEGHVEKRDFLFALNARILEKILEFRPDVVFGVAQAPMGDVEVLQAIKAAGILLCYWFIEDYAMFGYWKDIAIHFDHFFVFQKEPFYGKLKAIGCRNIHYLPAGFDIEQEVPAIPEQDIPVSFVGAPYPNRIHFFAQIAGPQFQIYGEHWNLCGNASTRSGPGRLSEAQCRNLFLRSKVNLNLHSSLDAHSFGEGDFVNPRTFDLAGLGLFQLVDKRTLLAEHFDPVGEVPMFARWEEYKEAIDYYLHHESERDAIAAASQKRVLAEHTYDRRAQEFMQLIT